MELPNAEPTEQIAEENTETTNENIETNVEMTDENAEVQVEATQEQATGNSNEDIVSQVDEQTENLPNTTILSTAEGDVTHNPVYDMGILPTFTANDVQSLNRDVLLKQLSAHEKLKSKFKITMNLSLLDDYAEKVRISCLLIPGVNFRRIVELK
jgi:hypothetical protein